MVPDDDAAVVTRLREAGAIILGKTNLPDFAGHGTRTESSVAGVTLNPYDVTRIPGGSSGGTATAVNASFAVLGLGSETGGSIQNPAAAQALVGVKPTYGLVPIEGVVPLNGSYADVVGPLAKTVHDAAVALDVLAGPTPEDLATYAAAGHMPENGYAGALDPNALSGRRFGLVGVGWRDTWLPLAEETEAMYREAVAALEARGSETVEDPFLGTGFVELYGERPRVPSAAAYDMLNYFLGLGPGAAFHSVEEWEALSGKTFREGRERPPPARPSATEEGDAFQGWRADIRALFGGSSRRMIWTACSSPGRCPHRRSGGGSGAPRLQPQQSPRASQQRHQRHRTSRRHRAFRLLSRRNALRARLHRRPVDGGDASGYAYDLEQATKARIPPN